MNDTEFDEQLRQEALSQQASAAQAEDDIMTAGRTRVDPDGTVYEYDSKLKAWFPKIDEDFIAQYQMSYGTDAAEKPSSSNETSTSGSTVPSLAYSTESAVPSPSDPNYYQWYYHHCIQSTPRTDTQTTDSQSYRDWYSYYYHGQSQNADQASQQEGQTEENKDGESNPPAKKSTDTNVESSQQLRSATETDSNKPEGGPDSQQNDTQSNTDDAQAVQSWQEYYAKYTEYYNKYHQADSSEVDNDDYEAKLKYYEYWQQYYNYYGQPEETTVEGETEKPVSKPSTTEATGKRKESAPSWFEVDQETNTNVYVSGLPLDITNEEYTTLMNKCGLIMYDPLTRKPKLKLYKDQQGNMKGDGLCCYIKGESVELALQILDGSDVRGQTISVQLAKFEMKGSYDPKKKKRKLTNKEKKKFKEKQEKLFDWRPDKPRGARDKSEKVVIIKNVFDPKQFDTKPELINEVKADIREECGKYGDVRKVVIYDRHPEGVTSVTFREPEEADVCIEAVNGRWFAGRQLAAVTWDGRSKYDVVETEAERDARLKKWEDFLDGRSQAEKQSQPLVQESEHPEDIPALITSSESKECQQLPSNTAAIPSPLISSDQVLQSKNTESEMDNVETQSVEVMSPNLTECDVVENNTSDSQNAQLGK